MAASLGNASESAITNCRTVVEAAARLACYDAIEVTVGIADRFGREDLRGGTVDPTPESIETHILGAFVGWQPRTMITLANGQVWQVTDDSSGSYRLVEPKVSLRKGMSGSFFLELLGERRSIRVKRIK
jgi:hypothetical protein